jgi:hypothetical protein
MLIDSVNSGTMLEIKWRQRSLYDGTDDRTVQMILLNPVLTKSDLVVGERISGWNCHIIYDSHSRGREMPYNKPYEIKWFKMCEREGNLRIILKSYVREKANK